MKMYAVWLLEAGVVEKVGRGNDIPNFFGTKPEKNVHNIAFFWLEILWK